MKNFTKLLLVALLTSGLFAGCVTPPQGGGATQATQARRLVAQHQNAIVTVIGTLKISMTVRNTGMSEKNEAQVEAIGTIVAPSGIVIAGTLTLDPVGSMMRGPLRIQQGGQTFELEMKSDLENLRFLLADKTEVPARVLLRDDDLGLFVLAADPKKGAQSPVFNAVPPIGETKPQLYSSYFVLGRANDLFQRAMLIGRGVPVNTLTKPRTCHTFLTAMMPVGVPVFASDGQFAGFGGITFRKPDLENPGSSQNVRPLPVLLPLADIRELLARAKQPVAKASAAAPAVRTAVPIAELPVDQARALIAAKQAAIVTLRGTVKFTDGSNPRVQEESIECVATLIDASGYAVCGSAGRAVNRKYQEQRLNYILADGTEVPARIVLQDDDLALTVLAPAPATGTKPPALPFLPLKSGVSAGLFDDLLTISRLDREHHYTLTAETSKITGVVTQPHPFYLADGNLGGRNVLGAPAFLADGRLLGLLAMTPQSRQPRARGGGAMQSEINIKQELVRIVPAGPIADLVEQAHQAAAKAPPKKD